SEPSFHKKSTSKRFVTKNYVKVRDIGFKMSNPNAVNINIWNRNNAVF
ncbi:unnamed protein product, partial [marine sediment metagenome]